MDDQREPTLPAGPKKWIPIVLFIGILIVGFIWRHQPDISAELPEKQRQTPEIEVPDITGVKEIPTAAWAQVRKTFEQRRTILEQEFEAEKKEMNSDIQKLKQGIGERIYDYIAGNIEKGERAVKRLIQNTFGTQFKKLKEAGSGTTTEAEQ